jgi:hypothetical protein
MSRKKRKQAMVKMPEVPKIQQPAIDNTSSPAPSLTQAATPSKPDKQRTNWVAWLALLVSLLSAAGTTWNARTSGRNYDRLAGRVHARLELGAALPSQDDIPPQLFQISPIFNEPELTLGEVDDCFRWNPRVSLKNVGDEPISEIRLETRLSFSFIDMQGEPEERQRRPTPWALEDATRDDYVLGEKLLPGKTVTVSITKGLLKQMIQLQANDRADRWHYGAFEIRCMAKLVNGVAFDSAEGDSRYRVKFRWQPKGFPEDKCKEVLEKLKHFPIVEK